MGAGLLEAVNAVLEEVARRPQAGTLVPNTRTQLTPRRYPVRRFPHYVVWVVTDDQIYVVAMAHNRRRPGYWDQRTERS